MDPENRRSRILSLVEERGWVSVESLTGELGVSQETVRRDLSLLDMRGLLRKQHGGARAHSRDSQVEGPLSARIAENVTPKRRIAAAAAALFRDGDTLFIDSGSTTIYFAESLAHLSGLTVITNSIQVAQVTARQAAGNQVFLLGGAFDSDFQETLGQLAVSQIDTFHAEHAVLTAGAVRPDRVLNFDLHEAELARAMARRAERVTVLADSSKFGKAGVFEVLSMSEVDRLATDRRPDAAFCDRMGRASVELIVAETDCP